MNLSFPRQIELVLEDGNKSGTHKFAFIRGIIDYAIENEIDTSVDLKIPLIHIAINHISYYWKFFLHDIKQTTGRNRKVKSPDGKNKTEGQLAYYKFISVICDELQIDMTDKIESRLYDLTDKLLTEELSRRTVSSINNIRKTIIKMPATYALNMKEFSLDFYSAPKSVKSISGTSFKDLYSSEDSHIVIPKKYLKELQEYKRLLSKLCILHWASLTDDYTNIPNSGLKYLEPPQNNRKSLKQFFNIYTQELGVKRCSYCDKKATAVDHIYPWKYAKRDEFWNMLPTCQSCNSKKSDKIIPVSQKNIQILSRFIQHILKNKSDDFHADLLYRSIIEKQELQDISSLEFLLNHTVRRCSSTTHN